MWLWLFVFPVFPASGIFNELSGIILGIFGVASQDDDDNGDYSVRFPLFTLLLWATRKEEQAWF